MFTPFRSLGRVGKVKEGMDLVRAAEALGTASGTPKGTVTIKNSGVV